MHEWDRTGDLLLPQDDGTAFRFACNILGGGDKAAGRRILREFLAHVKHADEAHPWRPGMPVKDQVRIADDEWAEFKDQYWLAKGYGMDDRDMPFCDAAKLTEHDAHMRYEMCDLIAVFVKMLRA